MTSVTRLSRLISKLSLSNRKNLSLFGHHHQVRRSSSSSSRTSSLSYEFGVPRQPPSTFNITTIGDLLETSAEAVPNRTAFIVHHQGIVKTYRQFNDDVDRLARGLQSIGVRRGEEVGIWAVNCYEWLQLQYATAKIGAIYVNINPGYKEREFKDCADLIGIETLICNQHFKSNSYVSMLDNISPGILANARGCQIESKELPNLRKIIFLDEQEDRAPSNVMRFSELLAKGDADHHKGLVVEDKPDFDDVINVHLTSGTTGVSKAAMLTHFNIVQNANFSSKRIFRNYEVGDSLWPVICTPNPLYHCFGSVVGSITSVYLHGTMVLPGPIFGATSTLSAIDEYRCNYLYGTPTMWTDVLQESPKYSLSTLKRGVMGGALCPPFLMRRLLNTLPSIENIMIVYGSTELSPVTTATTITDPIEKQLNSVGKVVDYVEMKLIDPKTGRTIARGEKGEVCFRGHCTFPGYYGQPDKTSEVVDHAQWYHTGDIGFLDADSYLTICGRLKEMIIRGGENIYPKEVEEYLIEHEAIEDAHVVGLPDERFGEELVAYLKLKPTAGSVTPEEVKHFLKDKLSHFKVPKHILVVDDFPRTASGKVRKVALKEMARRHFDLKENRDEEGMQI